MEYLSIETILEGILGISIICTGALIFHIMRACRLIEKQNEQLTNILQEIAKENKK